MMPITQSSPEGSHCINPNCPEPYPQNWSNNYCQSCGAPLRLQNRYIPMQKLGVGGFAITYIVWDMYTRCDRVLKVLVANTPKSLELFRQEAEVLSNIRHWGIPKVDIDSYFEITINQLTQRQLPCLVMEKIDGQTLQDYLDQHPEGCPEECLLDWLRQAVEILRELHNNNIIHRDLKPANFMVRCQPNFGLYPGTEKWGQLVAIDFGGAKQISTPPVNPSGNLASQHSNTSTRLFSPGYSPPEQINGGAIVPATDFYALGRTFIHLLTGRYPAELENPMTGELNWRSKIRVTPVFADLLDDMVNPNISRRPATATEIQSRLRKISRVFIRARKPNILSQIYQNIIRFIFNPIWSLIIAIANIFSTILYSIYKFIHWTITASINTVWGIFLGSLGGALGSSLGFWLIYTSPKTKQQILELIQNTIYTITDINIEIQPIFIIFTLAGLGTAWGLTLSGSFRQHREFLTAGIMGMLGYLFSWLSLQINSPEIPPHHLIFTALGIGSLTLGLGLPNHNLIHAFFATITTGTFLAGLAFWNHGWFLFTTTKLDIPQLGSAIAFFSFIGGTIGFSLGISSYIIIPLLRFLGLR